MSKALVEGIAVKGAGPDWSPWGKPPWGIVAPD